MSIILHKLCEIFEADSIDTGLPLKDLDDWDSLTALSIIAMLDSDYGITVSSLQIGELTASGLEKLLISKHAS